MSGAGHDEGADQTCIDKQYLGFKIAVVIRSRRVAMKQGFLRYCSIEESIGTKVSVRYRRSGCLSEVVAMKGSTVHLQGSAKVVGCF